MGKELKSLIFNQNGACDFPTFNEINIAKNKGIELIIFIDSNVCMNIRTLVNKKFNSENENHKNEKQKVLHLIKYHQNTNIKVYPLLSLIELCNNNDFSTLLIDNVLINDYHNKIKFALSCPYELLKSDNFQYNPSFYENDFNLKNALPLKRDLLATYCHLLKIKDLCNNGISKELAEKNLDDYLDWTENVFGIYLGGEQELARNLFGGNYNEFKKIIFAEGKFEFNKSKLYGTTWDIVQARYACNPFFLYKVTGENLDTFFVTNDKGLNLLWSNLSNYVITTINGKETNIITSNSKLDYFGENYLEKLNERTLLLLKDGEKREKDFDELKVLRLIYDLEKKMNIS